MGVLVDRGPPVPLRGLYVHVPFCRDRCTYCSFATVADAPQLHEPVARGILRVYERSGLRRPWRTVYLGGGTPSLYPPRLLAELLGVLCEGGTPAELTLEANPAEVDEDALAAWADLGVTRLSVGVQTFHDATLSRLGRHHDGSRARQALALLRERWTGSWSADLLVGWAGQTQRHLADDLARLLEFEPPHVSVYALTIEAGSALHARRQSGDEVAMSANALDLLDAVWSRGLEGHGYDRYEISNFARDGHRSLHNQTYWHHEDYLGLGPGASSAVHPVRWSNRRDPNSWLAALEAGTTPRQQAERVDPIDRWLEHLAVGLRTERGLDPRELDRRFSPAWRGLLTRAGQALLEAGILRLEADHLRVDEAHRLRVDRVVGELATALGDPDGPGTVTPSVP